MKNLLKLLLVALTLSQGLALASLSPCIMSMNGKLCVGTRVRYLENNVTGTITRVNLDPQSVDVQWDEDHGYGSNLSLDSIAPLENLTIRCIISPRGERLCTGSRVRYLYNSARGVITGVNIQTRTVDVKWDGNSGYGHALPANDVGLLNPDPNLSCLHNANGPICVNMRVRFIRNGVTGTVTGVYPPKNTVDVEWDPGHGYGRDIPVSLLLRL